MEKLQKNINRFKWFEKLTSAEKQIWRLIYYHPTFIQSRAQALDLMFCCIGTGIKWVDGELKDIIENNYMNATKQNIESFDEKFYRKALENSFIKDNPQFFGTTRRGVEFYKAHSLYENALAKYILDNIESLVKKSAPLKYFYPLSEYSNLLTVPKDVKPDWLALAKETCNLILLCDPTYRAFSDNRLVNQDNIEIAKKVKSKLLGG